MWLTVKVADIRCQLVDDHAYDFLNQLAHYMYSVSQKNPPFGFLAFFPNGWEFFN